MVLCGALSIVCLLVRSLPCARAGYLLLSFLCGCRISVRQMCHLSSAHLLLVKRFPRCVYTVMDADCCYVTVQRPGGIRGWNSAVQAFDSSCGYPGEGPTAPTRSKKEITSYFQQTERRTLPSQPKPAISNQSRIQLQSVLLLPPRYAPSQSFASSN